MWKPTSMRAVRCTKRAPPATRSIWSCPPNSSRRRLVLHVCRELLAAQHAVLVRIQTLERHEQRVVLGGLVQAHLAVGVLVQGFEARLGGLLRRQRCTGHQQGQCDEGSADHGGSPEAI